LRGHDWEQEPIVPLAGEWKFVWNDLSPQGSLHEFWHPEISVPGPWSQGTAFSDRGHATYGLYILLSPGHPDPLAIHLEEFLTAYELELNGKVLGRMGKIAENPDAARAELSGNYFLIPPDVDTLELLIRGSNFHHRHGGMIEAPRLGPIIALEQQHDNRAILGGILIGLMLMNTVVQLMRYVQGRKDTMRLINGSSTLVAALHFLCLHERWLYRILGSELWVLAYKLELATLFGFLLLSFLFAHFFFRGAVPRLLFRLVFAHTGLMIVFILVAPISVVAEIDAIIPYHLVAYSILWTYVTLRALQQRLEGAVPLTVAMGVFMVAAISTKFVFNQHVGSLQPVHYFFSAYILSVSWILSRRSALMDRKVVELSQELEVANQALEQTNRALEVQNQNLEMQVQERTAELMKVEQIAHELEMEQKRRDLEALSANNQMKMQLTRNLIGELQDLLRSGGDYQSALKALISGLHGQVATEERLNVLQEDIETINAEFYRRLQAQYPQLSKTEREICAYLKLNLTGKDIAMLRKTSINTVNVARHRIRKKLGLERDEELEAFIQQF
jgi:DNA-binding CsgD family transcriptional regulator